MRCEGIRCQGIRCEVSGARQRGVRYQAPGHQVRQASGFYSRLAPGTWNLYFFFPLRLRAWAVRIGIPLVWRRISP